MKIVASCCCGAVEIESNGISYFAKRKLALKLVGLSRLPRGLKTYSCCDHCVNHWGLDLCECGSGKIPCRCHGRSMSTIDERTHLVANNAWGR
jgi:hypothetical protein